MKIKIKRFDKTLPLPERKTAGAAAFDLAARDTVEIGAGAVGYVSLNIAVETPPGHFLLLAARSSLHKKGLMLANGMAIGDPDFCGDEDEYRAALLNFTGAKVVVQKGDRILQGMFLKHEPAEWQEVENMNNKTRGGFGSTGTS